MVVQSPPGVARGLEHFAGMLQVAPKGDARDVDS
jgi:hypothetical protein